MLGVLCVLIMGVVFIKRGEIALFFREQERAALPAPVAYKEVAPDKMPEPAALETVVPVEPKKDSTQPIVPEAAEKPLAAEVHLAVPFTAQAPTGNWKMPFKEACEESSVLMVHAYYSGITTRTLDAKESERIIEEMSVLQESLFGSSVDTTAAETGLFAEEFYGYGPSEVLENPTIADLKDRLNQGQPILLPAAGRILKNPNFIPPGPEYHMLVIRGYTKDNQFITNDPGTRHGESYLYSFDVIMEAMHDLDTDNMLNGKKVVLILHPKR